MPDSAGTDLLVASSGGHLTQLHLLTERIRPERPRVWVSYDHPHTLGLLSGEELVLGHGPSTRNAVALVRNWGLARRLLSTGRFARVVSTGAGIAVPFLLVAQRLGIEAHYVESATRVDGPSLSGRILEGLGRAVHLHTQHADWSGGRWSLVSSVFDGFEPRQRAGVPGNGGLRVVVSLGTHRYPFSRLVDAVLRAVGPEDTVLLQHGATPLPHRLPPGVDARPAVPGDEFASELAAADVVVAHAGTGIALSAVQAGQRAVVVPRESAHGEHVDDHQRSTARRLAETGLVLATTPGQLTGELLRGAASWGVTRSADAACIHLSR